MLPVIFSWGPITLYSFGLMLFIGFFLSLFVVWKKGREEHYEEEKIFDVVLISGLWAVVVARLVYVLLHLDGFGANIFYWLNIFGKPGFSLLGAMLGGGLGVIREANRRKWDGFEFADVLVTGVALMMLFGYLGAFLNGSGFGEVTTSPLGVRFAGMLDKRHPTQLYAALAYGIVFGYLLWVEGKYRTFEWYRAGKSGVKSGFLVFNYLIFSGLIGMGLAALMPATMVLPSGFKLDGVVWGLIMLVGGVGLYVRSGRELKKDWHDLLNPKTKKERPKRRERRQRNKDFSLGKDILS